MTLGIVRLLPLTCPSTLLPSRVRVWSQYPKAGLIWQTAVCPCRIGEAQVISPLPPGTAAVML